jgi:glycosyltransferase involved in cell wall biosynthesis
MRIFMLVQHPGIQSPLPKHTPHLIAALRSLGCTVETHPWGRQREGEALLEKVTQRFRDVLSVRRALRGRHFDIAVVKTAHDWHTLLRDISVVLGIRRHCRPVVLQLHGSRASQLAEPGRRAFKLATAVLLHLVDGIMVLSTEEQRQWQAFDRRTPVFTVKNPYVRASSTSKEPSDPPAQRRPIALFVGRLMEEKGIFDLVDALPHVLAHTECELVIVGDGEQEQRLRDRVRILDLEDDVTMRGYLPGAELAPEYERATIFVLPSWSEGFPTVLAEAMDAGLPIVTTPIRGAADHLVEGENALFAQPRDVEGLASAMVTLLRDADLRARMASANRQRIRMFEPEIVGAEYLQVLQSLVRAANPS